MALFKIFKGNQTNKLTDSTVEGYRIPTDGYAYYDTSTKKFYIDADYDNNGTITRQPINANHSDSATLAQAAVYETTNEVNASLNPIRSYYAHNLSRVNDDIQLLDGDGKTLGDIIDISDKQNSDFILKYYDSGNTAGMLLFKLLIAEDNLGTNIQLEDEKFINKNDFYKFLENTITNMNLDRNVKVILQLSTTMGAFELDFNLNIFNYNSDDSSTTLIGSISFGNINFMLMLNPDEENLNAQIQIPGNTSTLYYCNLNSNNELIFSNTSSFEIWNDISDTDTNTYVLSSNYGKYFLQITIDSSKLVLPLIGEKDVSNYDDNSYFSYQAIFSTSKDDIIYTAYVYQNEDDSHKSYLEISSLSTKLNINDTAYRTASIPMGQVDNTSTSTVFTATIPGITELRNGVCVWLRNGIVTSAEGFTININNLGAKPCYSSLAAQSRSTTIFNINYTMLLIYNEKRVEGGCWDVVYGYDSNTNTIGYQLRTNNTSLPVSNATYRYRLLFTSADGTKFIPANSSSSTNATSKRDVIQTKINPFGQIVYYGYTTAVSANNRPGATYLWTQYNINLGYSFNRTGAALSLTSWKPVYIKCAPQTDGSAIIDATTPYVQNLPTTKDGKIYIFLGVATAASNIELVPQHPIYCYRNGGIQIWTGLQAEIDAINVGVTNITTDNGLTGGPITSTGTISLADNYGDTKNPYGDKMANYILAGPSTGILAGPVTFRALTAADIPSITKSKISDFPTDLSDFTNNAGYLTEETDPTVPAWAKKSTKPSYSLSEITGAEDIQAIEALNGTSGFLKKTGEKSWALDTNTYVTQSTFDNLNVGVTSIRVNNGLTATSDNPITSTGTIGIDGVDTTNGSTTKVLTQKATWVELPTAASLGLSNAMHFIGITSTNLTDGSTTTTLTAKSSGSLTKTTGFSAGDVVIDTNNSYEYVWVGSSWERLGPDGSYKVLQTPITDNTGTSAGDETATRFIYSFSQDANGVVSVKTRPLPTYNNYVLTKATKDALGGIQIGYSESGKNYAVQLDAQNKAYVSVPWTDSGGTVKSITIKTSAPLTGGSDTATTTSGSYTIGFSNQNVNYVLAGPSTGQIAGAPTFRKLVAADIPSITKSKISDFPTQVSSFTNDAGYLTQETDPTVPSWAKALNKPSYSLDEITGAEDIQVIEALNGTGLLVKDGTNSWYLDATNYVTQSEIDTSIGIHEEDLATVLDFVSSDGLNNNAIITLDTSLESLVYAAQQKHLQFYVLWITTTHAIKFEIDEINIATNTAKFHSNCGNILYTIEISSNSVTESPMTGSLSVRTISDTKNTAGSTDISSKIYLIGAATQTTNSVTYSDNEVYTTNGVLTAKTLQATSLSASQSISTDANKNLISSNLTTADPIANGTGITYIASISQDAIGKITASKSTVRSASTSQTGVVQLTDSVNNTSTTTAATPNSVKTAYDLANSHKYWANIESTLTAAYDKQPEVKSIKIGNGTTATATKSVQLIYDATLEALNFVFA